MDINPNIRYYQNCDELPMFNFEKIRVDKDFRWLVYGFDGWGDVKIPSNATSIWEDILNEYAKITENNKTLQYFELVAEASDMTVRYENAKNLLYQIETRPNMSLDVRKAYTEELRGWRFYFNDSKPYKEEVVRLKNQLKSVATKMQLVNGQIKEFEGNTVSADLVKIKVTVQNILKRDLDLKKISVKEWLYTLESLPKQKAA